MGQILSTHNIWSIYSQDSPYFSCQCETQSYERGLGTPTYQRHRADTSVQKSGAEPSLPLPLSPAHVLFSAVHSEKNKFFMTRDV